MTDQQLEKLAELIAGKQALHPPKCMAFTDQDIAGIKALAGAYCEGQKAFRRSIITLVVLGSLVVFCLGLYEYIKKIIK
jgi:hypothetical protein